MTTPTEVEKLCILLPHWIEHNREHAAEFREWAQRAQQASKAAAAAHLIAAAPLGTLTKPTMHW